MAYRETDVHRYPEQAEKIAERIFSFPTLPDDGIPYWDFDAPAFRTNRAIRRRPRSSCRRFTN